MKLSFANVPGFIYSDAPQRSPEWLSIRATRLGASQLGGYMGKGVKGQYLAPRKNIEKEIAFSKAFGVPFSKFTNGAMQAGIDNEGYMADQYSSQMGVQLAVVGCYYNDWFVASPDRSIVGVNAGIEIKWLFDNAWADVLLSSKPDSDHYDQMQGQMWATGWDYVDYVAGNGNTGMFIVLRIVRDEARIAEIIAEGPSVLAIESMVRTAVFSFNSSVPTNITQEWN